MVELFEDLEKLFNFNQLLNLNTTNLSFIIKYVSNGIEKAINYNINLTKMKGKQSSLWL